MENSAGSNSIVCSGFTGGGGGGSGGFVLPMSSNQRRGCFGDEQGKQMEIENYLGSSAYSSYQNGNQQLPVGVVNVASVCHGTPLFSVWNDS